MSTPSEKNLIVEPGPITRITFNRPRVLNALNRATLLELESALEALPAECRVVVLTGAGDKAFVAGADIAEMQAWSPQEAYAFSRLGHGVLARLESMPQIAIAEVNGYALGGGCELMLAADFAIAADTAKLGQPEVGLGVTAGFGGTTRLLRRVGEARARQLLYTGETVGAAEARAIGLVNDVVPAAELAAKVAAVAERILRNAPLAVAATKRAVHFAAEAPLDQANAYEQQVFAMAFATRDQREGMEAFAQKRKPVWSGA